MRSFCRVVLPLLLAVPLSCCGWFGDGDKHAANVVSGTSETTERINLGNGVGLNLPVTVANYTRGDVTVGRDGHDATATYANGATTATVSVAQAGGGGSVIPFTGGGSDTATTARSDAALTALIAAVERDHPGAAPVGGRENVFTVRFGVVQAGRAQTLLAGDRQILAEAFCCVDAKWRFTYLFDAPAAAASREGENRFSRAIAWSRDADASVEAPE